MGRQRRTESMQHTSLTRARRVEGRAHPDSAAETLRPSAARDLWDSFRQ